MPIKIPDTLPARGVLERENIFVMTSSRATSQDIRPLRLVILNLMPTKVVTETQLLRWLSNTPLQIEIELLQTATYTPKNTDPSHLLANYTTFSEIRGKRYDGMIVTGAPVELLPFEQVAYWDELCEIMEWSKTHVTSTFHICWAAQAALYYHYGIPKYALEKKLFGVFEHSVEDPLCPLTRGFDDVFLVPHSRCTETKTEDVAAVPELAVLSRVKDGDLYMAMSRDGRQVFVIGHSEYDAETLALEYRRDTEKGLDAAIPVNYFPRNDPAQTPRKTWRSHAQLLYSNWLNYYVYQTTPYDLESGSNEGGKR
ncbi:MAG: homoserine O-succinyltransferase [Oscillospiraceae bacterium]|jgi:homoserine O-succinyltransferase|nr:homoserine O-succinyltransferase [Oscillospiraceae bacterium]